MAIVKLLHDAGFVFVPKSLGVDFRKSPGPQHVQRIFHGRAELHDQQGRYGFSEGETHRRLLDVKRLPWTGKKAANRLQWWDEKPYAERLIGSIRRECLDHVIVLGELHLRRIFTRYTADYHGARTHLALEKDAPTPRRVQTATDGHVVAFPGSWRIASPLRTTRRLRRSVDRSTLRVDVTLRVCAERLRVCVRPRHRAIVFVTAFTRDASAASRDGFGEGQASSTPLLRSVRQEETESVWKRPNVIH